MQHFFTKRPATILQLAEVELPRETETYAPVGHDHLALRVKEIGTAYLGDYLDSGYGLSKDGQQMFGMHRFATGYHNEMVVGLGFRNSYNKTLRALVLGGASIMVCDNQCYYGAVAYARKHTGANVKSVIDSMIEQAARGVGREFGMFKEDVERLKETPVNDRQVSQLLGQAFLSLGILRSRQQKAAWDQWKKPLYDAWLPRNAWSLYNAGTQALKTCNPDEVVERYKAWDLFIKARFSTPPVRVQAAQAPAPTLAPARPVTSDRFALLEF